MTDAEKTFALRMLPHLAAGMSFEAAGRAVLEDDARLVAAALATDHNYSVQTYDGAKPCSTGPGRRGAVIRSELASAVYGRLRAA